MIHIIFIINNIKAILIMKKIHLSYKYLKTYALPNTLLGNETIKEKAGPAEWRGG